MPEGEDERPLRRSREELRDLLIQTGRAILEEEGLSVGAGGLTFKEVFARVEVATGARVTNASVIRRVWENLAEYQTDVLVDIALRADSTGELDLTLEALAPLVVASDLSTPAARLASLRELARVGGEVGMTARLESREWYLWIGVWVLGLTNDLTGRRTNIREALLESFATMTATWEDLFEGICAHLGLRVRENLTVRQFTQAVSSMAEGSALRQGGDLALALIERPTGPGGELQQWTLFGVCLEALAVRFLEIDPDWSVVPVAA